MPGEKALAPPSKPGVELPQGTNTDHKSTNQDPLFLEPTLEKSWVEVEEV